jgi:hypothetical protein
VSASEDISTTSGVNSPLFEGDLVFIGDALDWARVPRVRVCARGIVYVEEIKVIIAQKS